MIPFTALNIGFKTEVTCRQGFPFGWRHRLNTAMTPRTVGWVLIHNGVQSANQEGLPLERGYRSSAYDNTLG